MRLNIYQENNNSPHAPEPSDDYGSIVGPDNVALGPVTLTNQGAASGEAITKNYADTTLRNLSASAITTGTLPVQYIPAFTGDATTVAGTTVFTLIRNGMVPGRYTRVTVDIKGRAIAGFQIGLGDIGNLHWNQITLNKPTTLAGYGITDALAISGGTISQNLLLSAQPLTPEHAATKGYLNTLSGGITGGDFAVGTVMDFYTDESNSGFLRANGGSVLKLSYPELYLVIGDTYTAVAGTTDLTPLPFENGKPWKRQHSTNVAQVGAINDWSTHGFGLPSALRGAQAVVTKNRVYLLGGINHNWDILDTVYTAPINSDGTLADWTTANSLPAALDIAQVIVIKNKVYLLGGRGRDWNSVSTVYSATVNPDGTLDTWSLGSPLPVNLSNSQAVVIKDKVYLLGGSTDGSTVSTVYTADVNTDGTLGGWTAATPLPSETQASQVIVTSNRVYLLGGERSWSYLAKVYTALINPDGTLGTWTQAPNLPIGIGYAQAVITKNRVYIIGGKTSSGSVSTVYTTIINPDGTLGGWTQGPSISDTVAYSQVIVTSGNVYLLGGEVGWSTSSQIQRAVFMGGLNDYSPQVSNTGGSNGANDPPIVSDYFGLPFLLANDPIEMTAWIKAV
jgi:N-acetylneuraminic acid mutarotase